MEIDRSRFRPLLLAGMLTLVAAYSAQAAAQDPIARGKYLVETIAGCGNCHSPRNPDGSFKQDMLYSGAFVIEEPEFKAYAQNITPDKETGIGTWTDEQIIRAVREGIRPDGRVLGPPMSFPFYRGISDSDIRAIVAFLRTVPAVHSDVPPSEYHIPLPPNYGPPVGSVPDVPRNDPVRYGEYLAGPVGHCMDCHSTYVNGQLDKAQWGKGGNVYAKPFVFDWAAVSRNITPSKEYGIGNWTDAEIKRAITEGIAKDGTKLLPFMAFSLYKGITDQDLNAIIAYLRSIPPLPE